MSGGNVLFTALTTMSFPELSMFFLKVSFLFVFVQTVKQGLFHVVNYFLIRLDQFGIGSPVEYNGVKAKIRSIGFSKVVLDTPEKTIYVSIDDFRKIDLIIPKDPHDCGKT